MAAIHLHVPKKIEREFVAAAKQLYPKEAYAYLLGTLAGDTVHIDELYIPDDTAYFASEVEVVPQPHWRAEALAQADESALILVGDIHSHPFPYTGTLINDHAQSEGDLDYPNNFLINGICIVQNVGVKKQRLRASIRWWGTSIRVIEHVTH